MSVPPGFFSIRDLPADFLQLASHILHSYSTGLIKVTFRPGAGESGGLIGSGTFVSCDGCFGVLTVHHVVSLIDEPCEIGFTLVEGAHRVTVDRQLIQVLNIAVPPVLGQGPDLAFMRLPREVASRISHYKHFYSLDFDREEMLTHPPAADASVWFVCGVPDALTEEEEPQAGFLQVTSFHGLCGAGGPNRLYEEGGFDYIDSWVEYTDDESLPRTFGGISGGGVWQVTYAGTPESGMAPRRYLLAGVPFAQSPLENRRRSIIAHGARSVYDNAYRQIKAMCA